MSEIFYDESMSEFQPLFKGVFPAHLKNVSTRDVNLKNGAQAVVYSIEYRLAPEVEKVVAKDDKGEECSCSHMSGKLFKDRGTFLFRDTKSFGKNRRYKELTDTLGIKLEQKKNKEGKNVFALPDLMDHVDDLKGTPVLVTLDVEKWKNKEGEDRTSYKVFSIQSWKDGDKLSPQEMDTDDEDIPF